MYSKTVNTESLDKGLIYTEASTCIGCNNCIRECPVLGANVAVPDEDENKSCTIHLDGTECILCGTCLDTCTHQVRRFHDDTSTFFNDIKSGKNISVIIAPALLFNYPKEYKRILGYLKRMGVNRFYSVSFGADITTWAYLNYITTNDALGKISQPCPSIVSYIEKHDPELFTSIIPVQSPMMCTAIYLKKYMGITDSLAFISPCIGKKMEMESPRGQGLISYNVTFINLMNHIHETGVNLNSYEEIEDEIDYGLGSLFPIPGGLKENVEFYLGSEAMIFQAEGEVHVYEYLKDMPNWIKELPKLPTLIDALNCGRGCNYGTATEFRHTTNNNIFIETHKLRQKKRNSFLQNHTSDTSASNFDRLNEMFKKLNLDDFMCRYENKPTKEAVISERMINNAYKEMLKSTPQSYIIDCRSCGYSSCKDMARAISLGINVKENCVEYVKDRLVEQMAYQQNVLELVSKVTDLVHDLNDDNVNISNDTSDIAEKTEELVTFCNQISEVLQELQNEFKMIIDASTENLDIARSTNILSINASIEAAHTSARGFAVIAAEVGDLAKKSMKSARANRDSGAATARVLKTLIENMSSLINIVADVKQSTTVIESSVRQITSATSIIMNDLDSLKL